MTVRNRLLRYLFSIPAILLFLMFSAEPSLAHQPRIVEEDGVVEVSNPGVSQAFYGWLEGEPQEFEFSISDGDLIYINLLVPDVEGIETDVSAILTGPETEITLDGPGMVWEHFYEPFARDHYLVGPEYIGTHDGGTYTVKVFSTDNIGKYVFVIGKKEVFPFSEIMNATKLVPRLKREFFIPEPTDVEPGNSGNTASITGLLVTVSYMLLRLISEKSTDT